MRLAMTRTVRRICSYSLTAALIAAIFCFTAAAQQVTGNVVGNVVDSQGGVIAGAQVTATNTETNLARSASTNDRGEFRIEFLPPGSYKVEIAAKGFRTFVQSGTAIQVGQFARVDATLQIGE